MGPPCTSPRSTFGDFKSDLLRVYGIGFWLSLVFAVACGIAAQMEIRTLMGWRERWRMAWG
jgi:hypothetical protein